MFTCNKNLDSSLARDSQVFLRHFEPAFDTGIFIFFITVLAILQKPENTVVSQESSHPKNQF